MEMRRQSDEEKDTHTPEFQLIRRKRPRSLETNHDGTSAFTTRNYPEKAPRLMALPGLAELLAAQKQRNNGIAADASLDVLSGISTTDQDQQLQLQQQVEAIEAEDKTPWPSAKQYYDIFSTSKAELKIPVYDLGSTSLGSPLHPEFIYSEPLSCMYFLKCSRLLGKGSFGFPRKRKTMLETTTTTVSTSASEKPASKGKKELRKDFEWRKMSFVTGLPKKQPIVRYITATCYSRATCITAKKKLFRMHAVMLADETGTGEYGEYVLVHIRAGGSKRVGLRASLADAEAAVSSSAYGTANAKQHTNSLCMKRPVSPTSVAVSSYSSSAVSTSPRKKKLLHAEFSSQGNDSDYWTMTPTRTSVKVDSTSSGCKYPLSTTAKDPNVDLACQALRNIILKSCASPDEVAKYVVGLQEELVALRDMNR